MFQGTLKSERTGFVLLGASLLAIISGAFWWYGATSDQLVRLASQRAAHGLVDQVLLRRHYEALNGKKTDAALNDFLGRDLSNSVYSYRFIKPDAVQAPADPNQDPFDFAVLDVYRANPQALAADGRPNFIDKSEDSLDGPKYCYYEPIRAKSDACLLCHNNALGDRAALGLPEWKLGDLMAVVSVTLPDNKNREALDQNHARLLAIAIITSASAIAAAWMIVHFLIVKPLRRAVAQSDGAVHAQ